MKNNTWIKPLTYALVFLIAPLLAYYLLYVQSRTESLIGRYYSHLTNITVRTEARFNSVSDVIENACVRPDRFQAEINGSDLGLSFIPVKDSAQDCSIVNGASGRLATFISQQKLEFSFTGKSTQKEENSDSKPASATTSEKPGSIVINVNPKILVGNIDQANRFYDIFIFDGSGNIVFQKRPENGRIDNYATLSKPNLATDSNNSRFLDDPLADLRTELFGRQFLKMSQPLQLSFESPSLSVKPSKTENVTGSQQSIEPGWRVVGLIDTRSFNSQKQEFQPETVAWTGLAIAIIVLLAPVLRLSSLGNYESFKKIDIVLLLGSFFTITTLLSLVVLEIHMRSGMNHFMDERLQIISNEIKENLENELHAALTELDNATEAMYSSDQEYNLDCSPDSKSNDPDAGYGGNLLLADNSTKYNVTTYPYFKQVYLIAENGCQMIKWSTHSQPSNRIIVKDRTYFRQTKPIPRVEPELFSIDMNGTTHKFYLEFITSRTTGEKSIALSMPIKGSPDESDSYRAKCLNKDNGISPCVSAMTMAEIRAFQAVLPFGFGFALINNDGDILFHHEGNANTELNLAAELGENAELQAALYGESGAGFEANYQGKKHRFRLIPLEIEGAKYSLVTFYAHDITVLPLLESAGVALFLWICWFSLCLSLAMLLWQLIKHFDWPFFDGVRMKLENRAHWLILITVPLTVACLIVPKLSFVLPVLIALIFAFWLFRRGNQIHGSPLAIVAASCAIMLATTTLPIFGFLKLIQAEALTGVMQLQIRDHNGKVERQRLLVREWVASRETGERDGLNFYKEINNPDNIQIVNEPKREIFWKRHPLFGLTYLEDRRAEFVAQPEGMLVNRMNNHLKLQSSNARLSFERTLLSNLPNSSDDTTKLHAMYRNPLDIQIAGARNGLSNETIKIDSRKFQNEIMFESHDLVGWVYEFLAALFVLIILYLALWYVLVRILGLRQEKADLEFKGFQMPEQYSGIREIVYGLRGEKKTDEFKTSSESRLLWIDLLESEPAEVEETVSSMLADFDRPEKSDRMRDVLIINHFDHCLDDLSGLQQRVALMERLASRNEISVVILMDADPFSNVTRTVNSGKADEKDTELRLRLAVYLSEYHATYFREPQIEETAKGIAEKTLRRECIHPNLRSIYGSIRKQKNLIDLDKAEIIQIVRKRADAIYGQMWLEVSDAEKIVLVDLAREHLVNPNSLNIARQLMERNYLQRLPFYRVFNESFKQFVLERADEEDIESFRKTGESVWLSIRTPFFIFIAAVVTFLGVTQPSFFNSIVALGTAAAAALPFLANLIMSRISAGTEK